MDRLPEEIVMIIIKNVSIWDFKRLAPVCHRFNQALHQSRLLQSLCKIYDVQVKDLDYLEAIKATLTRAKEITVSGFEYENGLISVDKPTRSGTVSWPEIIKLKHRYGVIIHTIGTIFSYYVADEEAGKHYPLVTVEKRKIIILGSHKFSLNAGDKIMLEYSFERNLIDIYLNGTYIIAARQLASHKSSKLRSYLYLHMGTIEPF